MESFRQSISTDHAKCEGVWLTFSHSAWSVCLSICHSSEPFNNGSTDWHAVWVEDSGGHSESCIVIFGFTIRTSPQCRSILVCENTKTELIYFNGMFPSKCIDRPRRLWRSYSSHSVWSVWSVTIKQNLRTRIICEPYLLLPNVVSKSTWTPMRS